MQKTYNVYQLIFLIIAIIILNYMLLWTFHHFNISPLPNNEIYLLVLTYLIILFVSALTISPFNLKKIHALIGFNNTTTKVLAKSILIGVIIWALDFIYQTQFLQNSLSEEALIWNKNNSKQTITFITMVLFAPIVEEILLRGILLQTLNRYINKYIAIIIVSLLFTLLHNSYEQWPSLFIASTFYCWITLRYKSIFPAIFAHVINNALTYTLYKLLIN